MSRPARRDLDADIADLEYLRDGGDDGDWECWQTGLDRYEDHLFPPDAA